MLHIKSILISDLEYLKTVNTFYLEDSDFPLADNQMLWQSATLSQKTANNFMSTLGYSSIDCLLWKWTGNGGDFHHLLSTCDVARNARFRCRHFTQSDKNGLGYEICVIEVY